MYTAPLQEPDNPPRSPVIWSAAIAVLIGIVLGGSTWIVLEWLSTTRHSPRLAEQILYGSEVSAIHMDQFRPAGEADHVRARQHAALKKYDWADRNRGRVNIPIDVAIALELEEAQR